MDMQSECKKARCTLEDALHMIHSNDEIIVGGGGCEPIGFLGRLHEIADQVENVTVRKSIDMGIYPYMTASGIAPSIRTKAYFLGSQGRAGYQKGNVEVYPISLSAIGPSIKEQSAAGLAERRVFVCAVTPPDKRGFVTTMCVQWENEAIDEADIVIFEVNHNMPRVPGFNQFHISRASCWYEVEHEIPLLPPIEPTKTERQIGTFVASLVEDGSCLQLGIGGIPNAAAMALMDKKDLGVHTELITPTFVDLVQAGVINCTRKQIDRGKLVGAFVLGTQELYRFVDENPMVLLRPSIYTNDPFIIAKNDRVVSINGALQVDLSGQIASEGIGSKPYSGQGGAFDFAYGARLSKGGKNIIALPSTAKKGTVSTIQPMLDQGAVVSISRSVVDYIVTEYGIAPMRDRTVRERVKNLIAVAHPDFRADLRKQAEALMLN